MRAVIRPSARSDVLSQVSYLLDESSYSTAGRFPKAVQEAVEFLLRNPFAGTLKQYRNPRLKGLRSWPVPGFENIRVYYLRPDGDTLLVLRILHGNRDLARIFENEKIPPTHP